MLLASPLFGKKADEYVALINLGNDVTCSGVCVAYDATTNKVKILTVDYAIPEDGDVFIHHCKKSPKVLHRDPKLGLLLFECETEMTWRVLPINNNDFVNQDKTKKTSLSYMCWKRHKTLRQANFRTRPSSFMGFYTYPEEHPKGTIVGEFIKSEGEVPFGGAGGGLVDINGNLIGILYSASEEYSMSLSYNQIEAFLEECRNKQ